MDEYSDDDVKPQTQFETIEIGDFICNINRPKDDFYLLDTFENILPVINENSRPFIKLRAFESDNISELPLNNTVLCRMLIDGASDMNDEQYFKSFYDAKLPVISQIIKQVYSFGFERPSVVQRVTIPEIIMGRDVLVQFKSGCGKTVSFVLGSLWAFDPKDTKLQHIFITSSHEVAQQIYDIVKYMLPTNTNVRLCIGQKRETTSGGFRTTSTSSLNYKPKIADERLEVQRAQVIVCTMGKFYDYLFNKKWIDMSYLKTLCVDEFDTIVVSNNNRSRSSTIMSMQQQMAHIIEKVPSDAQRIFFSATVNEESLLTAHSYFRAYNEEVGEPFILLFDPDDNTLEGVNQYYVQCSSYEVKKDVLIDLLANLRISQAIIFVNRIETAYDIQSYLEGQDPPIMTSVFHSELSAEKRNDIFKRFKNNETRLMIATDVSSRGVDITGINLVINFDMPQTFETYVHRIGRSGRYGKRGVAISLIYHTPNNNEISKVTQINERSKNSPMVCLPQDLANLL